MIDPREFLEKKRILIKDAKSFPINLTRDTHIGTSEQLILALDEYAKLIIDSLWDKVDFDEFLSNPTRITTDDILRIAKNN